MLALYQTIYVAPRISYWYVLSLAVPPLLTRNNDLPLFLISRRFCLNAEYPPPGGGGARQTYIEMFRKAREEAEGGVAAGSEDDQGDFWTWPEGGEGEVGQGSAAAATGAAGGGVGGDEAGASGSPLPPFLGRRPAAASGSVERAGDDRGESVAA